MFTPDMTLEQVKDSVFIVVITVHSSRMFLIFWNLSMTKAQWKNHDDGMSFLTRQLASIWPTVSLVCAVCLDDLFSLEW